MRTVTEGALIVTLWPFVLLGLVFRLAFTAAKYGMGCADATIDWIEHG